MVTSGNLIRTGLSISVPNAYRSGVTKDSFEGLKKELKEHGYPHVEALMLIRNMNVTDLMAIMEPTDAQR